MTEESIRDAFIQTMIERDALRVDIERLTRERNAARYNVECLTHNKWSEFELALADKKAHELWKSLHGVTSLDDLLGRAETAEARVERLTLERDEARLSVNASNAANTIGGLVGASAHDLHIEMERRLAERAVAAKARVERLTAVISKYARHYESCPARTEPTETCNCGYDETMETLFGQRR